MGMDDVWVVVPVFNEASVIGSVVKELGEAFPHVLCVDDGSSDGSATIAESSGATVLRHPINQGQGAALQTAFTYLLQRTGAHYCVTFDADGQHRVEDAVSMVLTARRRCVDVVLASRFQGKKLEASFLRKVVLRLAVLFTRCTTQLNLTDTHNGLRVLSRNALRSLCLSQPRMAHASELLSQVASARLSYCEVPICVRYSDYSRRKGQRNINSFNIIFDLAVAKLRSP